VAKTVAASTPTVKDSPAPSHVAPKSTLPKLPASKPTPHEKGRKKVVEETPLDSRAAPNRPENIIKPVAMHSGSLNSKQASKAPTSPDLI
jgi:hypothetical protein